MLQRLHETGIAGQGVGDGHSVRRLLQAVSQAFVAECGRDGGAKGVPVGVRVFLGVAASVRVFVPVAAEVRTNICTIYG